jgi:predicted dehydrogenase/threonine dehydrogenase-like Zn-dependent dehydrogenase
LKQVFQSLEDGTASVVDVPAPHVAPGYVLIRTQASIVSAGTERMLVDFGRANLLNKARQQPDRVKDVLDKVRTEGLATTAEAVRSKLGRPIELGYAQAGIVLEVGAGVTGLEPGDVVATNGKHAEVVSVPQNLVVKVPERDGTPLPADEAAMAAIGAVALQGLRLAEPALGERFVVTGLGLIGLLTVQLLRAQGCEVLGLDLDSAKLELAKRFGARTLNVAGGGDPLAAAQAFSDGRGVDGVIVTASTTSSEPIHQAARICRKRGRIVLVGVTGLELKRADFYEKELSFQVSCSYGPGRYDPNYEEHGHDYPYGFVRWTAGRNFEAFLALVANGRLDIPNLISHRYAQTDAAAAYATLAEDPTVLAIALEYPTRSTLRTEKLLERTVLRQESRRTVRHPRVAVIGAGNYTQQVLLPALTDTPAQLAAIVSQGGATAAQAASKFGFERSSTDVDAVLADDSIDAVLITTRHDSHADLAMRALRANKHVYVEKPLAIRHQDLDALKMLVDDLDKAGSAPIITVGFNRRFAPLSIEARQTLEPRHEPMALAMLMNAGWIPSDHWLHDPDIGGGRIVGEACHFIDLARYLVGTPIISTHAAYLKSHTGDTAVLTLQFEDGSIASIGYLANGSKRFPKERIDIFSSGEVTTLNNYRSLRSTRSSFRRSLPKKPDKGHRASVAAFVAAVSGFDAALPPLNEFLEVSRASLDLGAACGPPERSFSRRGETAS